MLEIIDFAEHPQRQPLIQLKRMWLDEFLGQYQVKKTFLFQAPFDQSAPDEIYPEVV